MRLNQRAHNEMRPVRLSRQYTKHAEGSVLVEFGDTKVLCTASVQEGSVPRFLKGKGQGWITAEYGMLPRSTSHRMEREASKGRQGGRTLEIQRLIGRTLRGMVNLKLLGENSLYIDCDVIQADGGTRTAAITGACIAVIDAIESMIIKKTIKISPIITRIAAVSVGIVNGKPTLDLDYKEDSSAHTDMNVVMNESLNFIEIQGSAEGQAFSPDELTEMLALARLGIDQLFQIQKQALNI